MNYLLFLKFIVVYNLKYFNPQYIASHSLMLENKQNNYTYIGHQQDIYYYSNITIGTPPQSMNVQVDTGSNILWVTGTNCSNCTITTRFNPSTSSTYEQTNYTYIQTYALGECEGDIGNDIITLSGTPINVNFTFVVANYENDFDYFVEPTSGIMGLSNDPQFKNLFQISQLFAFAFNKIQGQTSSYLFYNQFNQTILDSTIWLNTNRQDRWTVPILAVTINGKQQKFNLTTGLFDSGTTCLVVDYGLYSTLINEILKTNLCLQDLSCWCGPYDNFPTIQFYFKGVSVEVTAQEYLKPQDGSCYACILYTDQQFMILGDPFMQSFIQSLTSKLQPREVV